MVIAAMGPATGVNWVTRKVVALIVVASIGLLNVAVILLLTGTLLAPLTGFVAITVGKSGFTVNVTEPVVAPGVPTVTVTLRAVVEAVGLMANVAVILVGLTTVVVPATTVTPVPLILITAGDTKPVPVSVTGSFWPTWPFIGV